MHAFNTHDGMDESVAGEKQEPSITRQGIRERVLIRQEAILAERKKLRNEIWRSRRKRCKRFVEQLLAIPSGIWYVPLCLGRFVKRITIRGAICGIKRTADMFGYGGYMWKDEETRYAFYYIAKARAEKSLCAGGLIDATILFTAWHASGFVFGCAVAALLMSHIIWGIVNYLCDEERSQWWHKLCLFMVPRDTVMDACCFGIRY